MASNKKDSIERQATLQQEDSATQSNPAKGLETLTEIEMATISGGSVRMRGKR